MPAPSAGGYLLRFPDHPSRPGRLLHGLVLCACLLRFPDHPSRPGRLLHGLVLCACLLRFPDHPSRPGRLLHGLVRRSGLSHLLHHLTGCSATHMVKHAARIQKYLDPSQNRAVWPPVSAHPPFAGHAVFVAGFKIQNPTYLYVYGFEPERSLVFRKKPEKPFIAPELQNPRGLYL